LAIAFIALVPLLTMRVLAEERARGTETIVAMTGVGAWRTLLAKFAVSFLFVGLAAAIAFLYPAAALSRGGAAPELPTSFLGLWLHASALASIGLAASAASRSQLAAAVLTWAVGFALWDLSWLAGALPGRAPWLATLSLQEHFVFFADGLVAPGDVVFFLGLILIGLCCGRLALAAVRVSG
jgi:ABC-2 type transport system permease protein